MTRGPGAPLSVRRSSEAPLHVPPGAAWNPEAVMARSKAGSVRALDVRVPVTRGLAAGPCASSTWITPPSWEGPPAPRPCTAPPTASRVPPPPTRVIRPVGERSSHVPARTMLPLRPPPPPGTDPGCSGRWPRGTRSRTISPSIRPGESAPPTPRASPQDREVGLQHPASLLVHHHIRRIRRSPVAESSLHPSRGHWPSGGRWPQGSPPSGGGRRGPRDPGSGGPPPPLSSTPERRRLTSRERSRSCTERVKSASPCTGMRRPPGSAPPRAPAPKVKVHDGGSPGIPLDRAGWPATSPGPGRRTTTPLLQAGPPASLHPNPG